MVLPSRSALSDLGLILDLLENMLVNWSFFCLKSPLFALKIPTKKSDFHLNSLPPKAKNFLKMNLLQIKVFVLHFEI